MELQEQLGSCCGILSAQSGCTVTYCRYMQPSIPWECRSKPPWDAPWTNALFLTFCWPPQQRLLDRVHLGALYKTIPLAQPFPLTQFMPRTKISLGSSLNCCKYLHRVGRTRAWRRLGKHCTAITSQIKAAACSPAPLLSPRSHLPSSCHSPGEKHHTKQQLFFNLNSSITQQQQKEKNINTCWFALRCLHSSFVERGSEQAVIKNHSPASTENPCLLSHSKNITFLPSPKPLH